LAAILLKRFILVNLPKFVEISKKGTNSHLSFSQSKHNGHDSGFSTPWTYQLSKMERAMENHPNLP